MSGAISHAEQVEIIKKVLAPPKATKKKGGVVKSDVMCANPNCSKYLRFDQVQVSKWGSRFGWCCEECEETDESEDVGTF